MTSRIPSGTVTFLFSDIEGSTRSWENHEEWMQWAFKRQEQIMRQAMASCGGYVYKMIGDAFQVAFDTASAALQAALISQRALQSEDWGEYGPLRVRMALHTGVTEERGDDYVGPALNRVARVLNAGHGGQVLLTQATCDLLQDDLPANVSLRSMGEHHLKDLIRPENIYQLLAPGLLADFPRLKTLSALPNNLPLQRTSFVGRQKELAEVRRLLQQHRLVTLTGPGGTGKTRLALQVASEVLESFEDGVWLVELAPLADPQLIPQTTASALGITESPGKTYTQALVEYLYSRQILLIFDNCEHVLEDSLELIDTLLRACPQLRVLTTSREILGDSGEVNFRCPSLSVPNLRHTTPWEELAQCEAVQLFIDRATSASADLKLSPENIKLIARICQRLDGIPLAIELAAARVRMLNIEGIAARLDDSFRLLTGGSRNVLPRQQTLRACIDWSYNLLSPAERVLLMRLSVFAGGWILEAAEQVCADPVRISSVGTAHVDLEEEDILDLTGMLVDKSLVMALPSNGGETRFRLLDTIRQYARERLLDDGSSPTVRDRHLAYYLMLAEEAEPHLRGKDQVAWLDRIESEMDNLRFALEWSLNGKLEAGLRLASALLWFWHIREYASEGLEWLNRLLEIDHRHTCTDPEQQHACQMALAKAKRVAGCIILFRFHTERGIPLLEESAALFREMGEAGRVELAITQIYIASHSGDWEERYKLLQQAETVLREAGEQFYLSEVMMSMTHLMDEKDDLEQVRRYSEETLSLRRALQDLDGMGMAYTDIGNLAFRQGHLPYAVQMFQEAMNCFQAVGNKRLIMNTQSTLGTLALLQGDIHEAAARFEDGIRLGKESGDRFSMGQALYDLGRLAMEQGNYHQAARYFEEMESHSQGSSFERYRAYSMQYRAYAIFHQGNLAQAHALFREAISLARDASDNQYDPFFIIPALGMLAQLTSACQQPERAARLYGLVNHSSVWDLKLLTPRERQSYEDGLAAARAALSEEAFAAAWAEGERMTLDEAVALALGE